MAKRPPARKRRDDSYFGLHFDLHPHAADTELGRLVSEAMVRKILRATRPDYLQYDCKGHVGDLGYPRSAVSAVAGRDAPGGEGIVNDSLAIYRKATAEAGVQLFVHFSGVWDNVACTDHPEWAAVKADGARHDKEGRTSTFGAYVRERMIPQMKEVVDRYEVDGFWIDGDCWAAEIDYCDAARARFQAVTGQDAPPVRPGEPHWFEWMTIQRDAFLAYVATYLDALHEYRPGLQIASNWLYSPVAPEPVRVKVDFISGDYSPNDSVNSARFNGRQMASAGLPWDLMAWGFATPGGLGNKLGHVHKPAEQLQQEAAAVLALGGGFQVYYHPDRHGGFPGWQIETMRQVADFCHARKDVCFKTQRVPQVGLLLDTTSVFRTSPRVYGAGWAGEYQALQGMLHAVLEAGHAADVLADHQLPWQQDHWPVLVVPEWEHLPVGVVTELADYARRGGSLLISGARTCGLFREHLGVAFEGEPAEADTFLQVEARSLPTLRGSGLAPWAVPLHGVWQSIELPAGGRSGPRVLAWRTADAYGDKDRRAAATLHALGDGRIAAVYGPLGLGHYHRHAPALRDFVGAVLERLYQPRVSIDFSDGTPHCIDLAVREKDGKLIVHLNNVAGMPVSGERYVATDRIPPVGPLRLEVRAIRQPRSVRLEPERRRLMAKWRQQVLRVTVPRLHIHAAVVVS